MKTAELAIALQHIKKPVSYDKEGAMIFDAYNNHIMDVWGYGSFQYMINGEYHQDCLGRYIAECINNCPDELLINP